MSTDWSAGQEEQVGSWLARIPGYRGYREKDRRRDADRLVREDVVRQLNEFAGRVEQISRGLADRRQLGAISEVESLVSDIRHLSDRIATATYGYGGLFGDRPIGQGALDQLRHFDESLGSSLGNLGIGIDAIEAASRGSGSLSADVASASEAVRALDARLNLRSKVIETATPLGQQEVDSVLGVLHTPGQKAANAHPHPAYNLQSRDAVAVEGEDFIVDSRVNVEGKDVGIRLFRIASEPDRWLLAPQQSSRSAALLTATDDVFVAVPSPRIGDTSFVMDATGTGRSEVAGASGTSGTRAVTYSLLRGADSPSQVAAVLDWGTERLVLVGSSVESNDIVIYGSSNVAGD